MLGIYCRTSKNRQDKFTIENQKTEGIKCANDLGLKYKIYTDDGVSGTLDESVRDGFADLLKDIHNKEITHVYCIDQSRIERDTRTWEFFVAECLNYDIKYFQGGVHYDLENITNRMLAQLMSVVNAYYAEITSKKVRLANAQKAKEGKTHGLKAYGYKKGSNNMFEIDEEEAVNVKRMFQLSLQGVGTYTIANIFNEEGIPTKFSRNFSGEITRKDKYTKKKTFFNKSNVKWRGNVIHDMLTNPIYKGIREWNRHEDKVRYEGTKYIKEKVPVEKIIFNDIPVIIEPELWDEVNENLQKNKKNVGKKAEYHYLLNGLITCHHCQDEFLGKKRLKGRDNAYKCKGKRPPHKTCTESRGISLPKLETFIIHHLFYSKDLKKLLVEAPKNGTEINKLKDKRKKKELDKEKAIKAQNHFFKLLTNPELKQDENLTDEYIKAKKRVKSLEKEIEELDSKIAIQENSIRNTRSKSLIEGYSEDVGFDEVKRLVHSLIEKIEILHQTKGKTGYFILKIKYKHYEEYSIFTTDWQALKWKWAKYYREGAITEEDKSEDLELMKYLLNGKAKKKISDDNFNGFTTSVLKHDVIDLNPNELIKFD
jgi:site-specific DNA recombinase